jgi:hypothetical protein
LCAALYISNLFSPRRRIEERASLKHRNASRFLQEQAKRAKLTKDKDIQVPYPVLVSDIHAHGSGINSNSTEIMINKCINGFRFY